MINIRCKRYSVQYSITRPRPHRPCVALDTIRNAVGNVPVQLPPAFRLWEDCKTEDCKTEAYYCWWRRFSVHHLIFRPTCIRIPCTPHRGYCHGGGGGVDRYVQSYLFSRHISASSCNHAIYINFHKFMLYLQIYDLFTIMIYMQNDSFPNLFLAENG